MKAIIPLLFICVLCTNCTHQQPVTRAVDFEKENGEWKIAYLGFHYYPM